MTASEFRPVFERVCDHFGIHGAKRSAVWRLCINEKHHNLVAGIAPCYAAIARSLR